MKKSTFMKIYITGGSGTLGRAVLNLIPNAVPLVRRNSGLKNEKVVDFNNHKKLKHVLKDCDVLIHLAASLKFYDKKDLYEANVLLTENLIKALPKNAKIIYSSSVSVYGKNIEKIIDENTPPNPDSDYAKTKYYAERLVMKRKNSIALRIGAIYAPEYPMYSKVLKLIKNEKMVYFGNGKNLVSFVHVYDVAKAIKNSLKAKPGIYVISAPSESIEKIYRIAAELLGVKAPTIKVPLILALLLAYIHEKICLIAGKEPFITQEVIRMLGRTRVFDFSKAKKELKFNPRPLEKGIKEMVNALYPPNK